MGGRVLRERAEGRVTIVQWHAVQAIPLSAWGTGAWHTRHEFGVAPRWVASTGLGRVMCPPVPIRWQAAQRFAERGTWQLKQWFCCP